jgi:hypothetical protein
MNAITAAGDLVNHFINKLHTQSSDIGKTAELAGLDDEIIIRIIMTGLVFELIKAARYTDMDEKEFLSFVRIAYREAMRIESNRS